MTNTNETKATYQISMLGRVVALAPSTTLKRARAKAARLDAVYGATVHSVTLVQS
jgi:hypothetical protein